MIQSQNVSKEVICFELRQQSRRATNSDAVLVTEEGEEVTAHQAVLGLHSRLLRNLLQQNTKSCEVPKVILCGVSKTILDAFVSLFYCGEVRLDRPGTEDLTELLTRLDVDLRHLSVPGFLVQTQAQSFENVKEHNTDDCQDVKLETNSAGEEEYFSNANLDDDCGDDINEEEEKGNFNTSSDEMKQKVSVYSLNEKYLKTARMGGLRKKDWKNKMQEEIQQGKRFASGRKKVPHVKREIPQKARKGKFMCPECGNIFTMQRTLKKHIEAIHQGIRYPCDKCPFQGRNKILLKHHIESVHEGKRYYCDQCEFIAFSKYTLRSHVAYKHCENNYQCDQCDYKTKTAQILQVHINSIHLKIKLTCPECGSKHSQKSGLLKHRRLKHGYMPEGRMTNRKLAMVLQSDDNDNQ